jgi:hypothetical protein
MPKTIIKAIVMFFIAKPVPRAYIVHFANVQYPKTTNLHLYLHKKIFYLLSIR